MKALFPRITRRTFLQAATGAGAGMAASGLTVAGLGSTVQSLTPDMRPAGGPESWVATTCLACPGACGVRVRKIGERAVYVKGNPEHALNRGGLCPRALASLQLLYHPDRLRSPLRRAGERGSNRWTTISWEEALSEMAARWGPLRDKNARPALVFLTGRRGGLLPRLMSRFLSAFPNGVLIEAPSGLRALQQAVQQMQGIRGEIAVDLEAARYTLNFGCNLLEGWGSPVHVMRAYARWRETSEGQRSKLVHIAPRLSVTGAKADEWVPLRPGTEEILALGIAYALIAEDLYDREFVEENSVDFADTTDATGRTYPGFKSRILQQFRLGEVGARTGVPAETILRLAREFSANRPALALGNPASSFQPGSLRGSMAVHCLNVLMGSAGTLIREAPSVDLTPWPGTGSGGTPPAGQRSSPVELWEALHTGRPFRAESVFLQDINPVLQFPGGRKWAEALKGAPFVVASAGFLDESAAIADLVLPAPHFLEAWDEAPTPPGATLLVESVVQPVVQPGEGVRHPGDVLLALAKLLGGSLTDSLPESEFGALVARQAEALYQQQRGYVFAGQLESTWYRLLQRSGWWAPTYRSAEELWEQMRDHGGWWVPPQDEPTSVPVFSPAGGIHFMPEGMRDWPSEILASRQGPVETESGQYPLVLEPFEVLPLLGGRGAEAPALAEGLGQYLGESWQTWAELHPETAARCGVAEGQWAWVESREGRIRARVRVRAGLHPELVAVPVGLGRTAGAEWIKGRGANPADLLGPRAAARDNWLQWWGERVRVYPA